VLKVLKGVKTRINSIKENYFPRQRVKEFASKVAFTLLPAYLSLNLKVSEYLNPEFSKKLGFIHDFASEFGTNPELLSAVFKGASINISDQQLKDIEKAQMTDARLIVGFALAVICGITATERTKVINPEFKSPELVGASVGVLVIALNKISSELMIRFKSLEIAASNIVQPEQLILN
jgi:hypothetical protein